MQDRFKFRAVMKTDELCIVVPVETVHNTYYIIDTNVAKEIFDKKYPEKCFFSDFLEIIEKQEYISQYSFDCDLLITKDFTNLMQCTGLKDKNGKLIFEGDILKETKIKINWDKTERYTISCVFWDRTQFQLGHYKTTGRARVQRNKRLDRLVEPKCKFAFCDYTPIKDFVNAEIIGNIYENPELLEGGE